jgi:hypothetical protein
MLNVFLPLVSIKSDIIQEENQYLNIDSMKDSDDYTLNSLSNDINRINLVLWVIIILGFSSFFGLIIKLSGKAKIVTNIIIIAGCATILLSIICCILNLVLIKDINSAEGVFPAFIYLNLLLAVILMIATTSFTIKIVKSLLKYYREFKRDKKEASDKTEIEEIAKIKKADSKEVTKTPVKKPIKFKLDDWEKKTKEKIEFSEKNKEISPQKFNVKCPDCRSIFEAERKPDGVAKIKCPKCGKEGVIK